MSPGRILCARVAVATRKPRRAPTQRKALRAKPPAALKKTSAKSKPGAKTKSRRGKRLPKIDIKAQIRTLKRLYPGAQCSLTYKSPFQLLIATILSAQCTDVRVNIVTPELFRCYPTPKDFAEENLPEIEEAIRTTGFFRSKSKSIQRASREIVAKHGGKVPADLDELVKLAGVGRKTANVVLGNAFNIPGVVVDTHVTRLSNRLGMSAQTDAVKIEFELMEKVPRKDWTLLSHLLIYHGRALCQARKPHCTECGLARLCPKIGVAKEFSQNAPAFEPTAT